MSNNTIAISLYKRANDITSKETIPLDIFLGQIQSGEWQDIVIPIRNIKDKEKREEAKKKAPNVTISGKFIERYDNAIETHSGYIAVDVDKVEDPEALKEVLMGDKFVYCCFISISGKGLCLLFKIKPDKHREAFQGISEYLYNSYKIICDPTAINPSRARFVSYDPHLYLNEKAEVFKQYPKSKPPKKLEKIIYSQDDFTSVLNQLVSKRLNITENYHDWLRIGFSICHKFGEAGRQYFHIISQYSSKYDSATCDKQYDACLKREFKGNEITISTFYYYAKQAGLEIYSERTKTIAYVAAQGKKSGLNPEQIAENLEKYEDIKRAESIDIIKQVHESNIEINEDSLLDQLELWIRTHYSLRRNEITRYIESDDIPLQDIDLNDIFIKAKKIFDKLTYELMDRLLRSRSFVPSYNPIKEFFAREAHESARINLKEGPQLPTQEVVKLIEQHFPLVTALFRTIRTKDTEYTTYFGAKWLVGIVSAAYGKHSPLMFVLSGDVQNTGKTEWFRNLLPSELMPYYAESKLDAGKDDEILMTQKILIMDDEMGGKSKKEIKRLKELTSKQTFSLREPYGRNNVDLMRMAVLAGTSNDNELLSDPTGNRRIIPIPVYEIDFALYNSIDKAALFHEVYNLYKCGLRWRFTREDINYLGKYAEDFEETVVEAELLSKYFKPGSGSAADKEMTASEIKVYIEHKTQQKLSIKRLGQDLRKQKFERVSVRSAGQAPRWIYKVQETGTLEGQVGGGDDVPF